MDAIRGIRISSGHLIVAFILFFSFFFLLNLIRQPVIDWDEAVYLYLSEHMTWYFTQYTTQGSFIDNALPQGVYSSPVFHHPPLIPYLIKLLSFAGAKAGGKILNFFLYGFSLYLVFVIGQKLSDLKGALLALTLWVVCPSFNLEARIVHLDFPCTVLILAGLWFYLKSQERLPDRKHLALAGIAFALAMLTKYTAPLYVGMAALLFMTNKDQIRDLRSWISFGGPLVFGFVWWIYILIRFGSLTPSEFIEGPSTTNLTPYLKGISERGWYDIWIYFLAICPLFIIYVWGIAKHLLRLTGNYRGYYQLPDNVRILLTGNAGMLLAIILFSVINAFTNGYWILRHIMPIFPIIYITIGWLISNLWDRGNRVFNAYLIPFVLMTLIIMISSTFATTANVRNLKVIPILLFWVKLEYLFH